MDLVALPEVKAVNCRDLGGRYLIDVECTNTYWNCPKCGGDQLYDHAAREVDYTDTPLHGMPCLIRLKKRRQRCKDCKHVCACVPNQHFDEDFQITLPESLTVDLVTLADQEHVILARHKAAQDAAEKIRRDTESFVADCVASLREQTAQLCQEMLDSIGTSETGVHQKTLNRLVKFIDQFKAMNFVNDTVMEQQLEQAKKELLSRTAEEYRDSATARNRLVQGLGQLRDKAKQLAKADATVLVQRFGELGRRKFNLAA